METNNIYKMLRVAFFTGIISITLIECKKEKLEKENNPATATSTSEGYTSVKDFFTKNGVALQTFSVDGAAGGTFTTPQGTKVTIPANAFVTSLGAAITGTVTIEFKDICKKSDMLLSNMPTQMATGPLKSAGEFFIKAIANGEAVKLANWKSITVEQPALGKPLDLDMKPFQVKPNVNVQDSAVWQPAIPVNTGSQVAVADSVLFPNPTQCVYEMYQFQTPASSGSWCNSDNSYYFSSYSQTTLTIHPNFDISSFAYNVNVFLVFTDINSMVHVYGSGNDFPYNYAPVGLKCTVVAIGVKDGKFYSSFTPITISANQTVNFDLTATTTDAFKTTLKALD